VYFTDRARVRLFDLIGGKRIEFRHRSVGKLKKVSGIFVGFYHTPDKGFFIQLIRVRWRGRYWGRLTLKFCTRDIVWTVNREVPKLLQSGEPEAGG